MPKHSSFLRDLGSGSGFLLPDRVFLYGGRRTYLYNENEQLQRSCSKLDPPEDFMSKRQVYKLHKVEDNRNRIFTSVKVRRIGWVDVESRRQERGIGTRTATSGDAYLNSTSRKKIYQNERSGHQRSHSRKSRDGSMQAIAEDKEAVLVESDWEPQFQAGVHFFVHKKTGECREHLNGSGGPSTVRRPQTAPASLQTPAAKMSDEALRIPAGEALSAQALLYDPKECHDLLDYLEGKRTKPW